MCAVRAPSGGRFRTRSDAASGGNDTPEASRSSVYPVAEDAGGRPTRSRDRTRLQQSAERDDRLLRSPARSEEHTSELQSLMRNSYSVCCLNKKKCDNSFTTYTYTKK